MKERALMQYLDEIAAEGIPADTNLWPGIQARVAPAARSAPISRPLARRWRLATVISLTLLLAAVLAIAATGPQRVWAGVQRVLGYVPGIGFVDLKQTRVLVALAEVTREGVTVRVEQAIAGPDGTRIVLRSEGLPPDEGSGGVTGGGGDTDIGTLLRLPGGPALAPTQWSWRYGAATFEFPALPADVDQATLELERLPLVPAGRAPENWRIALTFQPATGQLVAERFPQPYRPENAVDAHAGITLRVLEVAHSAEETAVRVQVTWDDPQAEIRFLMGGRTLPVLRDDKGNTYQRRMSSRTGSVAGMVAQAVPAGATPVPTKAGGTLETELVFQSISMDARDLSLEVDGVEVEVPAEGQFSLDLGEHPVVGDHWPLDVNLDVAGLPVRLTGARLVEEELRLRDGMTKRTTLEFDVDPVADQDGRGLRMVWLRANSPAFNGSGGGYNFDTNRIRAGVNLQDGAQVPSGPLTIHVTGASIVQSGPWRLNWEIPGR